MKTILISGAGGAALPFLIGELKNNGYRVIATDMDKSAVGLFLADKGYVVPAGLSKNFIPELKKICQDENVDLFIPLVDEELVQSFDLTKIGVKVLLPNKDFTSICLNKKELMKSLMENEIPVPKTYSFDDLSKAGFPLIIKPITGRGSRGIQIVNSKDEINEYLKNTTYKKEELMIQQYIEGDEYTVSVVVNKDGLLQAVVPKKILLKKGITKLAISEKNKAIIETCEKIQELYQANGPFNVQLKINKYDFIPYIFEINPRFSTSISLTIASGVNELILLTNQLLKNEKPKRNDDWNEGIVMVRQTLDTFMPAEEYQKKLGEINL